MLLMILFFSVWIFVCVVRIEVILVTREPKLKIFRFRGGGVQSQNFHTLYSHRGIDWDQLVLVREVGLLSSLAITSGRQIVGLSSGYLRPYSHTRNRKQVIVLVNEGWGIFVFNHKLRLMWTRAIETDLSLRYLAEVAILVDPHPMRKATARTGSDVHNDTGVIIVGGRLALKSSLHANELSVHTDPSGVGHGQSGPSPLEFPADFAEALQGRILRPGRMKGTVTSDDERDMEEDHAETLATDPIHFERDAHFSYYAFEGLTGDTRWRHDSTSFVEESAGSSILRPQHESLHSGEMDWRVFRQSLLETALPHQWEGGRAATHMTIAHVEKTRTGALRQSEIESHRIKSNFFVRDSPLGSLRPHSDSEHVANPNAIVVHLRDGIELLHLYSGRPLCRLTLKAGEVHVDMNGDGVIDHVEAVGGIHRANSLHIRGVNQEHHESSLSKCVAVVRSGIPPSGQLFNASICLSSWSDLLRFGGMLRTVVSVSMSGRSDESHNSVSDAAGGVLGAGRSAHLGRGGGRAFSMEGAVGSTDGDEDGSDSISKAMGSDALQTQQVLQVAHPIVVPEPHTVGKSQFNVHTFGLIILISVLLTFDVGLSICTYAVSVGAKRRRYHSFFFLSSGLVTSFNHDGSRTWHTQTHATWLHSSAVVGGPLTPTAAAFHPSLTPFSLHVDTPSEHVLVVGERKASLLSLGGSIKVEWTLAPDIVVAKPIIADFNNDGINDIVMITTRGSVKH
jgi:hypothetical protein